MRNFLLPILFALSLFILPACGIIKPNTAGINVNNITGHMAETPVTEGLHATWWLSHYIQVPLNARVFDANVAYGAGNMAVSSDRQGLGYAINLSWQVGSPQSARELLYHVNRNPGPELEVWAQQIIAPSVDQAVKSVFVRYTLSNILTQRDQVGVEVAAEIHRLVEERMTGISPSLADAIDINQVVLTNLDYDPQLKDSIEQTQIVAQERLRAQENLETERVRMQLGVAQAEADRESAVTRAQGEADAMRIQTEALVAQFRSLRAAGIDPNLYVAVSRWDGHMPMFVTGDGGGDVANLLINIPTAGTMSAEPEAPVAAPAPADPIPTAIPIPSIFR